MKNFNYYRYLRVCCYFSFTNNNKSIEISKALNIKKNEVEYYIDLFLSQKRNYMGSKIDPPSSRFNYTDKKINQNGVKNKIDVELYENNEFIGSFSSISDAANFLDVKRDYIYIKMAKENLHIFTINHSFIGRKITYKIKQ